MPKRYSAELRQRAIQMVAEALPECPNETAAITHVAGLLGVSREPLRQWIRKAEVDAGRAPGVSTVESVEIKRLRRENAELRRANEILKAASVFFAKELDQPATR